MKNALDIEHVSVMVGGHIIEGFADGAALIVEKDIDYVPPTPKERVKTFIKDVRYCVIGAGPVGHPQKIFDKISIQQRWDVLEATPHTIGDCWIFKCQFYNDTLNAYLPSYIRVI